MRADKLALFTMSDALVVDSLERWMDEFDITRGIAGPRVRACGEELVSARLPFLWAETKAEIASRDITGKTGPLYLIPYFPE